MLCRLMEVSRSSFYAWRSRPESDRSRSDADLTIKITEIHERSRKTYGSPRVHGDLRHCGTNVGRKRVARLMRLNGLVGAHSRKKWRKGNRDTVHAPDLVERQFQRSQPNELWVADITELRTDEGKLFLAGIKDLASNAIVGWSMGERQTTELVIDALVMAFERRDPATQPVHHSDRGCQTGLNRSSQHRLGASLGARRELRLVSSSRVSCVASH
jgi:transposase InsO family protein